MLQKILTLMLAVMMAAAPVWAEQPAESIPAWDGVVFDVSFLDGGDILLYGSFGRQAANGRYGDTLMRARPDGTEVWSLDFPFPLEEAGMVSKLLPLSDGRYLMIHALEADDLRGFFIDPADGSTTEIALSAGGQQYFALEDGLIEASMTPGHDGIALRWLDFDGQERMRKEYPVAYAAQAQVSLLESGNGYYVLLQASPDAKGDQSVLMKITASGLLQWKITDDSRYGFGSSLYPDGAGGVLLMAYQGSFDSATSYPYLARRIDAQGNTVWEKELEVGTWIIREQGGTDAGIQMLWEGGDTFQTVTLAPDGTLQRNALYEMPAVAGDASRFLSGITTDTQGQPWVYYLTVREIDMYTTDVQSLLRTLDTFPLSESQP